MKKKIWLIILSIISVLACTFGFAACDKGKTPDTSEDPPTTHEHVMQEVQAKDATCAEEGNIHYFYCSDCQKYFEDEAGAHELNADSIKLSKTTDHVYGAYTKTAEGHTRTCSVCGMPESGSHSYVNGKCSVCDYEHQDHSFGSYTKDENGHSHTCTVCGKVESDSHSYSNGACSTCGYEHETHHFGSYTKNADGHSHTCDVCGKTESDEHTYVDGTCTECEYVHTSHSFGSYTKTEDGHTHTCSVCGKTEGGGHEYANGKCSVCEYAHQNHTFGAYTKAEDTHTHTCSVCHKEESDSHSYENGKCSVCEYEHQKHEFGDYISNEDGHSHTCNTCGKTVSGNHTYENGRCTTCEHDHQNHSFDSYTTDEETHTHTCSVCHKTESDSHTYTNGKCSVCQYEHKSHTFGAYAKTEEGHTHTCSVCHKEEGDSHSYENGKCSVCEYEHQSHTFEAYTKTEDTHTHTCSICHKSESDNHAYANGTCTVCEYEHQHHTFGQYSTSDEEHFHTCDVCHKVESGKHTYENGKCSICDYVPEAHSFGPYQCTEEGHTRTCNDCEKVESGEHVYENGKCKICQYEHKNHVYGNYSKTEEGHNHACTVCHKVESGTHEYENGKCTVCQYEHLNHSFGNYTSDASTHTHTCDVCGLAESGSHTYKEGRCTTCEYEHTNHKFGSYTSDDSTHSHICDICQKVESSSHEYANGTCSICRHEHVEHSFGAWTQQDASCTENGYKEHTCDVCHKTVREEITSTGHSFDEHGICGKCGDVRDFLAFKTLQADEDGTVYGKVSNVTEIFSFIDEVTAGKGVTFTVSTDLQGQHTIPTKTTSLNIGDNTFYLLATKGEDMKLFTVTVRRRPVYTVLFETSGSAVLSQQVEEDSMIAVPEETTRTGYTFQNWTLNGNAVAFPYTVEEGIPQTSDYTVTMTAVFTANVYTATLDAKGGEVSDSEQTVTFDHSYNFPVPTRTGYTFVGWYEGDNKLTGATGESLSAWKYSESKQIEARWSANSYQLTVEGNLSDAGTVTGGGSFAYDSDVTVTATTNKGYNFLGWYNEKDERVSEQESYAFTMGLEQTVTAKWDFYTVTVSCSDSAAGTISQSYSDEKISAGEQVSITSTTNRGYTFLGWYSGETEISTDETYSFTMGRENVDCEARWKVSPEMENFIFTSDTTTCTISGIKDNTVTEIVVPDYVTGISGGAFKGCSQVEGITLPFVGESRKTARDTYQYPFGYIFGWSSFSSASLVTQIYYGSSTSSTTYSTYYIPDSLKSVTVTGGNILYGAFYNCSGLTSMVLPVNMTSIGGRALYNCSGLTSIVIPDSVTSIGSSAFSNCKAEIIWGEHPAITEIGPSAFSSYQGANLTIPEGVISIGRSAFSSCSAETITLPDSVMSIGSSAFSSCTAEIVWGEHPAITEIGPSAFSSYEGASLEIPDGVTSIGYRAFSGCSNLTSLTVPHSVTSIGQSAFYGCNSLASITLPFVGGTEADTSTSYFSYIFGDTKYSATNVPVSLKSVIIKGGTSIGGSAFSDCSGLTEIIIPEGVTSIGYAAFNGCSGLTEITIPQSIETLGKAIFGGCCNLERVTLPFVGESRKTARDTYQYPFGFIFGTSSFEGASAVEQYFYGSSTSSTAPSVYYIPDSLKSVTVTGGNILYGAFQNCSGLESIVIPDSVTSIGSSAFGGCSGLTEIIIPDSVTSIGGYAFYGCSGLTSIEIPENVTYIGGHAFSATAYMNDKSNWGDGKALYIDRCLIECGTELQGEYSIQEGTRLIAAYAFSSCHSITSITIPDSVTSIGSYAFYGCFGLTSVTIGSGVTSIGDYAFQNCSGLTSVALGSGVTSIGYGAFMNCDSLLTVYYGGSQADRANLQFDYYYTTNGELLGATWYYYSAEEPALNAEGTEYDGNYWKYGDDGRPVIWKKQS